MSDEVKIDVYAQHPESYSLTFWIGFCMLGGYKFFIFLFVLILFLFL
tara:strand:+ start:155 stop:295 length:141 start_codon:yes stop_codon:yes gene_type:complete